MKTRCLEAGRYSSLKVMTRKKPRDLVLRQADDVLVLPLDLSKPKSFAEAVRTVLDKMGKVKSKSFKKHNIQNEQIVNVQVSCLLHNPTR